MRCRLAALFVLSATLLAQTDRPKTFQDEYNAWFKTHPLPNAGTSQDQRRAFDQELTNASATWVQHWPNDPQAWLQRLKSLSKVPSTSDRQLEEAGEMVVKVAKEQTGRRFRFVPFQTEVAEIWSKKNIRLEQCLELTQEAVLEDERAQSDNPSAARRFMPVVAQGLFQTLGLEASLATRLKKFEIAEQAIDQMKQYLDEHPENRIRLEPRYLADGAYVADREGHKPDALLYYSELFRESSDNPIAEMHAHQLWKELGGTDDGFNNWTHTIARVDLTPPRANQENSPWTAMNKPLTAFHGTDTNGRFWTSKDLEGKATLVIVWATWCRPCQTELPMVQKIFDDLKNRQDAQVLTVSTDDNVAVVAPFVTQSQYTFPVISVSSALIDKMVGMEGIPRTWIVDAAGSVRFELVEYDPTLWPDQVLKQLASVR